MQNKHSDNLCTRPYFHSAFHISHFHSAKGENLHPTKGSCYDDVKVEFERALNAKQHVREAHVSVVNVPHAERKQKGRTKTFTTRKLFLSWNIIIIVIIKIVKKMIKS